MLINNLSEFTNQQHFLDLSAMSSSLEYLLDFPPPEYRFRKPIGHGFGFAIVKAAFHVSALIMTLSRWLDPFRAPRKDSALAIPGNERLGKLVVSKFFCGALSHPRPDYRLQVMVNIIWQSPMA